MAQADESLRTFRDQRAETILASIESATFTAFWVCPKCGSIYFGEASQPGVCDDSHCDGTPVRSRFSLPAVAPRWMVRHHNSVTKPTDYSGGRLFTSTSLPRQGHDARGHYYDTDDQYWLLIGDDDQASVANAIPLGLFSSHVGVAFSADGSRILASHEHGLFEVFDASTNILVSTFYINTGYPAPTCIALNFDGTIIAVAFDKYGVILDACNGVPIYSFSGAAAELERLWLGDDGSLVVGEAADRSIRIWNYQIPSADLWWIAPGELQPGRGVLSTDGRLAFVPSHPPTQISAFPDSLNARLEAYATSRYQGHIIDTHSCAPLCELQAWDEFIDPSMDRENGGNGSLSGVFGRSNQVFATLWNSACLRVYQVSNGSLLNLCLFNGHLSSYYSRLASVSDMVFGASDQSLFLGMSNGAIMRYDLFTNADPTLIHAQESGVDVLVLDESETRLVSIDRDGKLIVFDPRTGIEVFRLDTGEHVLDQMRSPHALIMHEATHRLAAIGSDGILYIIDLSDGKIHDAFNIFDWISNQGKGKISCKFSESGDWLLISREWLSHSVACVNLKSHMMKQMRGSAVALSSDESRAVIVDSDGGLVVYALPTWEQVMRLPGSQFNYVDVAFCRCGTNIVVLKDQSVGSFCGGRTVKACDER